MFTARDRRKTILRACVQHGDTVARRSETSCSATPRPSAAARPAISAVPEGAFDFLVVMRLDQLDIKSAVRARRDPFGQLWVNEVLQPRSC